MKGVLQGALPATKQKRAGEQIASSTSDEKELKLHSANKVPGSASEASTGASNNLHLSKVHVCSSMTGLSLSLYIATKFTLNATTLA